MQQTFIAFLTVFLLVSCNGPSQNPPSEDRNLKVIEVKEKDIHSDSNVSDLIEIDSLVYLEFTNESIIGPIQNVIVTDDRIYILDRQIAHKIFCFDRSGNFINAFQSIGRGPLEYTELCDMSFFNNLIYVTAHPKRLFQLDKDLNFSELIDVNWNEEVPFHEHHTVSLSVVQDSLVIFCSEPVTHLYHFYNLNKGAFESHQIQARSQLDYPSYPPVTRSSKSSSVFISQHYNNIIFKVIDNDLTPYFLIDFDKAVSDEEVLAFVNRNPYEIENIKRLQNMHGVSRFMDHGKYFAFDFTFKSRRHFYFYNKANSNTIIFPNNLHNDLFGSEFFNSTVGVTEKGRITTVSPSDLIDSNDELGLTIPDDLDYESNPVLVFYRPKF